MKRTFLFLLLSFLLVSLPLAQEVHYFRLSAGPPGSTLFSLAAGLANIISNPPGTNACEEGGPCGVPGLIALAQNQENSKASLHMLNQKQVESAIVSGDQAYFAYRGNADFGPADDQLRMLGTLDWLGVHIVVLKSVMIYRPEDLKGKRIAIATKGSDNEATAKWILENLGIFPRNRQWINGAPMDLYTDLRTEHIDALIIVDRPLSSHLDAMFRHGDVRLLDLEATSFARLQKANPMIQTRILPEEFYPNEAATRIVLVPVLWITRADLAESLAYDLSGALFHTHPEYKEWLRASPVLPLHPGTARYLQDHPPSTP